jgi:CubicO group peptidase (beta-lactamase class C family)
VTAPRTLSVAGDVAPGFEAVRDVFEANLADAGDGGFAYAAYRDGRKIVDLWTDSWAPDALPLWMSVTKALTALCVQILSDRGVLDVEAPVARYWPEFAQAGKDAITIAQVMTHRSGVLGSQELTNLVSLDDGSGLGDTAAIAAAIERAAPLWEPGTKTGYHTLTYGWILGEVVRRVDGRDLGGFFREEAALPLGVDDVWIGTPSEHHDKIPDILPALWPDAMPAPLRADVEGMLAGARDDTTPAGVSCLARDGVGALDRIPEIFNHEPGRTAPLGGSNLAGPARSVAKILASLDTLVSPESLETFTTVRNTDEDLVTRVPIARALGYWRNVPLAGRPPVFGPNEEAFGHTGVGGQIGFADPKARVAVAFVRSHHTMFGLVPLLLNAALYGAID